MEWCARRAGCADLGLRIGERLDLRLLGLPWLVALRCRSLAEHFELIERFLPLHTNAYTLRLRARTQGATACLEVYSHGAFPPHQFVEMALAAHTGAFRRVVRPNWRPQGMLFAHAPLADPAEYRRVFGCPVTFGAGSDAIVYSARDLAWRSPRDRAVPVRGKGSRSPASAPGGIGQITEVIRSLLPGPVTQGAVAEAMGLSPVALQRRLGEHGLRFGALRTQVRGALAHEYLRRSTDPLTAVATRLGFGDAGFLNGRVVRQLEGSPGLIADRGRSIGPLPGPRA
jgi:AraC-like DNA-binding protein